MSDLKRIRKEYAECKKDPQTSGLDVSMPDDSNLLHWKATIKGPIGTPYEGGLFRIDIQLPSDYPFVPPKMKYETRIWHPNISSESGAICLDILKNEWSPALTVRTALISLQALMSAPEPDDPQDAVVASQYKKSYEEYKSTAKYWTETYATGNKEDESLRKLVEMGFEVEQCKQALEKFGGDENKALDSLLAGLSGGAAPGQSAGGGSSAQAGETSARAGDASSSAQPAAGTSSAAPAEPQSSTTPAPTQPAAEPAKPTSCQCNVQ